MTKKRIAIIGAGPAGLAAAYELSTNPNNEITLYEMSDVPGGMCKTIKLWDCLVDIGPHRFFSYNLRVNKLWLQAAQKDYKMVNRLTRIFYKNKFFFYPIAAFDALKKVGVFTAAICALSYLKEKIAPIKQDGSFKTWTISRFGKKLYTMFFKTYSEKLWGIKCSQLDDDFARQRIKKLSMSEVILNALKLKKNQHKTLADKFAYPKEGAGLIYRRMAEYIQNHNGKILYNTSVKKVIVENGVALGVEIEGRQRPRFFDEIISTMPFTDLIRQLPNLPAEIIAHLENLKYRNSIIVYLKVEGTKLFDDNWLYVHSPDLMMGRITNFRNWIPELYGKNKITILALEYWCNENDAFWNMPEQDIINTAKAEIQKSGLSKNYPIIDGYVYKVSRSYPTYHKGYKKDLKPLQNYLDSISNLQCIGRNGAFKYNNQDHSLLMGILAAENIKWGGGGYIKAA